MKQTNNTLTWLLAGVLSLVLFTNAEAQSAKQRTGKVVRIKGDARYSNGNKIWQPLAVGAILKSGTIVQTAPNSFVDVVLNEEATAPAVAITAPTAPSSTSAKASGGGGGSKAPAADQDVIRILDDSYLVFDTLNAVQTGADRVTETMLDLKKGSVFGSVKKQAAASRFEIKIPNGVAGIRGTIFYVSTTFVSCIAGSVVAAYTGSSGDVSTQVIGGGNQLNTNTGVLSPISDSSNGSFDSMFRDISYSYRRDNRHHDSHEHDHDHEHDHVSEHGR